MPYLFDENGIAIEYVPEGDPRLTNPPAGTYTLEQATSPDFGTTTGAYVPPTTQVEGGVTPEDIASLFVQFGVDPMTTGSGVGTSSETPTERYLRIANEINSGQRTLDEVSTAISQLGTKFPTEQVTAQQIAELFVAYGVDPMTTGSGVSTSGETAEERYQRIADEVNSGERTLESVGAALGNLAEIKLPSEAPGVMPGGNLVSFTRADGTKSYMQVYEWPVGSSQFMAWEYDGPEQLAAIFGADWLTTQQPRQWNFNMIESGQVQVIDLADEIMGVDTSFTVFMDDTLRNAAVAGGITDPTLYGRFVSDTEVQNILAQAALGDWTEEQHRAALRNTRFYQEDLYPGIATFYGEANPEDAWRQYVNNVTTSLELLGVDKVDGSYRQVVGDMLNQGVSDELFVEMTSTFQRAAQSPQFAAVLDQWTQSELGRPLDFDTWFDVLSGQAPEDVMLVAEEAMLAYEAQQQVVDVSADQVRSIAEQADLSEAAARQAFSTYAQNLQALGDRGLQKYNLSREEILGAAAGIKPSSGRSIQEVQRLTRQAAREEGVLDDPKIQFFVGYDTERGTPKRPGLNPLAPEGG